jgi:hypothetical protein
MMTIRERKGKPPSLRGRCPEFRRCYSPFSSLRIKRIGKPFDRISATMLVKHSFNVLTTTAFELRDFIDAERCTSVDLFKVYLAQISLHNRAGMKLNAIIFTAPVKNLIDEAGDLDKERA